MAEFRAECEDQLKPSEIEHNCDMFFSDEVLEQEYNYIDYHFDCDDRYFWARAYTDSIGTVSVHGPFDARETRQSVSGALDGAMLSYLKRRFREIRVSGGESYVVLWSA